MSKESTQHKLDRVRKPRVQITYDVEVGGAVQKRELPFVVGVVGDFSGQPDQPLKALKEREFIDINRDNFDKVLAGMGARLSYSVENKLTGEGKLGVELRFDGLDDFEPDNVVQQVEAMRKLAESRRRLSDLLTKMDGNERLGELLQNILQNSGAQQQLSAALGLEDAAAADAKKEDGHEQ